MLRLILRGVSLLWLMGLAGILFGKIAGITLPEYTLAFVSDRSGNRELYLLSISHQILIQLTA
ncbi:MAG TPA: hypothetical protein VHL11_15640, partial [Phototrophicaceae bacterium]|nr:hypothetical protein [Phototrophicaceae bacterium]